MNLGSGKVAGKVLIVDHYNGHAKILILLETVIEWCCVQASNLSLPAPFSKNQWPRFKAQVTVSKRLTFRNGSLLFYGVGKVSGILL